MLFDGAHGLASPAPVHLAGEARGGDGVATLHLALHHVTEDRGGADGDAITLRDRRRRAAEPVEGVGHLLS